MNTCQYETNDGKCGKACNCYKFICDEHAEEIEDLPYMRYCDSCGKDTFNEECTCYERL